jgi:hypothetical protein
MRNDSSIRVTRGLEITVLTPDGEMKIRVSRLSAQIFAATLRAYSGVPTRGVELNAGTFDTVFAENVPAQAKTPPVVRLSSKKRGVVHLR